MHQSRRYGYSPKNSKAFKTVQSNREKNLSCMVAIKKTGIIAFIISEIPFNGDLFKNFINDFLVSHFLSNPNNILILDNCRFHKRNDVIRLLEEKNINHRFLPPYSPQLNPIEEYFSYFKSKLNSSEIIIRNLDDLKFKILEYLSEELVDFSGRFRNMRRFIEKALARQHFI